MLIICVISHIVNALLVSHFFKQGSTRDDMKKEKEDGFLFLPYI